jgi:hypothetical protein
MILPTIKGIGITQQRSATSWKATGEVESIGWLEAWNISLIEALEAIQALAAQYITEQQWDEC